MTLSPLGIFVPYDLFLLYTCIGLMHQCIEIAPFDPEDCLSSSFALPEYHTKSAPHMAALKQYYEDLGNMILIIQ